nr:c1q globular head like domain containing protein [uncultured Mediterranean phage uvMED]
MAYIGKTPVLGNFVKLDAISVVNGQAAYTMQNGGVNFTSYDNVNQFLVSLNGILQSPTDSFTVSGSTLTFASNLSTGDVIDFVMVLGNTLDVGVPSDNTVSLAKLTATGTKDATTFLRGDNSFSTITQGITEADEWRLTANKTVSNTFSSITTNLARTTRAGFSLLGTGMSESSGIFTFPNTGYWIVGVLNNYTTTNANRSNAVRLYVTTNNSTYYNIGSSGVNVSDDGGASNSFGSIYSEYLIDVTSTTNVKVYFDAIANNSTMVYNGSTSSTSDGSSTRFMFRRIGDT